MHAQFINAIQRFEPSCHTDFVDAIAERADVREHVDVSRFCQLGL